VGGKSAQSTQAVTIPPAVLAQYQSVVNSSNQVAQTPFKQYGNPGETNADGTTQQFVAPVNQQQQTGIANTNAAANEAQPGYAAAQNTLGTAQANTTGANNAALGLAGASAGAVNADPLTGQQINSYLSPYLSDVLGSTSALLNQNNQQQQSGQLGTAIQSGAFGSDRTGIAAANLEQQQNLANANIYSGIANTGYNNALGVAQQQQGVNLSAGQANRTALANAGQEIAGIGQTAYGEGANTASEQGALSSGAQTAGLQGANAQLAAGTVQQQTQQAQDTAEYNQFLQQQSFPYQVQSWLAGISEGTGALSGSQTTTTQPGGFFSDRRLKHDIKKIGETFDKQTIYSYKMHGDDRTHIGLMAQDVEKKRPRAVGVDPGSGYKMVDYGQATEKAANRGHFYEGGVVPMRKARASGGPSIVDAGDLSAILQAQQGMYAPMSGGASGVYGGVGGAIPRGGSSRVPAPEGAVPHLVTAQGGLKQQPTGVQNLSSAAGLYKQGKGIYDDTQKPVRHTTTTTTPGGVAPAAWSAPGDNFDGSAENSMPDSSPTDANPYKRGGRARYDDGGGVDFDSLAAAHGAMYGQGSARPGEDIPSGGGGSHQLAVASGSPQPAPSGSSNLNQGLGLAQKGYQAYKHFNTPSASPDSAPNTGPWSSPDVSGASFDGSTPVDMSGGFDGSAGYGVAAPAAPAAAPAATSGLGSAGAADVAGSAAGAAGEGAADAAVAGGADAAAAAAAEALAADAAVAVIAAKRGGKIKRGKFDAGGMPYSNDDGSLDIPDTSSGASALKTAGPLQKQPTGLQTLETLGTEQGAQGAISGMFSNQALKRGGVAGARRGYATDGSVDDDTDNTDAGPSTAAPVADAPSGVAAAAKPEKLSVDSGPSWWDRNKGKIIPLAEGLAAMGTAPTRSFGTALAAGLGAGARSYVPTNEGLADTRQTESETQGINLRNQIAQQKLNYLKSPSDSAPTNQPSPLPSQGSYAPADLRKQYYVPPIMPDEAAAQQYAYKQAVALGNNAPIDAVKAKIKARYDAAVASNRNDAQQNFDDAYGVATKAADPELRASAASVADAYSQWTGDQNVSKDGVLTNSRTNKPPVGEQAQRLSPSKYADLMNDAMTKVPVPTGRPGETTLMPKWQVNGGNSAADYVSRLPPSGTPGVGARPSTVAPAPARAAPVQTRAPTVAPPPAAAAGPANPVDAKAFSDPKYKLAPIPTQIGTTAGDAVTNQVKQTSEARAGLQADAEQSAQSTGSALQFAQAAKSIMDSKGAPTVGLTGNIAKTISSVFGGVDATNYQEVAKYLGNLAVQSGKGNFPHATEKENMVQFNDLSPSVKQTGDALRDLLNTNVRNLQYTLDTANRTTDYLDPKKYNGDPQKFFRWNQEHYPRADVVNTPEAPETGKSRSGRDIVRVNGKWQYKD
jgi:Chaperone of endosialidase